MFSNLTSVPFKFEPVNFNFKPFSVQKTFKDFIGNTGKFFKNLAFIGLALSCVNFNKFFLAKIKSVMLVL